MVNGKVVEQNTGTWAVFLKKQEVGLVVLE